MNDFISKCGKWLEYQVTIDQQDVCVIVGIALDQNSLSKAYLYFRKESVMACFPVNCFLRCELSGLKMSFDFFSYGDDCIDIICEDIKECNIIFSQIAICTHISKLSAEQFQSDNQSFLSRYSRRKLKITRPSTITPSFPLNTSQEARKTWMARTSFQNSSYYTKFSTLPILIYTWNIAQRPPEADTYESARHVFQTDALFIALVLQEIDFSAKAVILGNSKERANWNETFDKASEGTDYVTIIEDSLGGVFVRYMAKKQIVDSIKIAGHQPVRLGLKGFAANKSAIITKLNIGGVMFAFIGCHLTPHNPNYEQRNMQMIELLAHVGNMGPEPDYTVIFGDLNYRVDLDYDVAVQKCAENDIQPLLDNDQLYRFLGEEPQYKEWHEEKITFLPTYKFDMGCNVYDTSKKLRIPSWTDRILFKVGKKRQAVGPTDNLSFETDVLRHVNLPCQFSGPSYFSIDDPPLTFPQDPVYMEYKSYPDILFSDHRPVLAYVKFPIPQIDPNRKKAFKIIQMKRLDEIAGLSIPRCSAEPTSFETSGNTEIKLTNISCSVANWKTGLVPDGVRIEPDHGEINPAQTQEIHLICEKLQEQVQFVTLELEGGSPVTFEFSGKKSE